MVCPLGRLPAGTDQAEGEVVAAVGMALRAIEERITLREKWLTMRAAVTVLPPREPVNGGRKREQGCRGLAAWIGPGVCTDPA